MHKVLIIDDDRAARGFYRAVLEKLLAFEAAEAESVAEGLACLNKTLPDLIMLDSNLEDGTARDLCLELEKTGSRALAVPKLIISGLRRPDRDDIDWGRCNVKGYLVKPCSIDDLKDAVTRCLEN